MMQTHIAKSLFQRLPPLYGYKHNYDRFIKEGTNVFVENHIHDNQIAYFRYQDGSTMFLNGDLYHSAPPCITCDDVRMCSCNLPLTI